MGPKANGTRALIYGRVSFLATRAGKKRPSNETSIERQFKACEQYAGSQGWKVVGKEQDRGVSAFKDVSRPGWERVVAAVESGRTDVVLVHALDRAARNTVKILQFVELCQTQGVAFVSVTQDINTGGTYGPVVLAVLAAVAQVESLVKRERALLKHAEDAEAGRYAGSYRPFGYTRDMEQVPAEVEAIRHGAQAYLNGTSLRRIARVWNDAGLTTTPGNAWDVTAVGRVFANPIHVGDRVHVGKDVNGKRRKRADGTVYRGDWKPILPRPTWNKLVARITDEAKHHVARRSDKYLLTGLLTCGVEECGRRLVGRPSQGVRRYVCVRSGKNHLGIAAEPVEQYVGDEASLMLVKQEVVRDPAKLSAPLLAELEAVEDKLAAFARNAAAAGMPVEEIVAGRAPLAAERDRVQVELDRLADEPEEPSIIFKADSAGQLRSGIYAPEWEAMIAARVDHVEVLPVGRGGNRTPVKERVVIHWRPGVVSEVPRRGRKR